MTSGAWSGGAGIIPARAGFTSPPTRRGHTSWDHPRSRGVYCRSKSLSMRMTGSSPLARGLRGLLGPCRRVVRIIPARAGFTRECRIQADAGTDHPRSRGVYPLSTVLLRRTPGSSPLARGLPSQKCPEGYTPGIIPARAGFTVRRSGAASCGPDHPRSRGVYRSRT